MKGRTTRGAKVEFLYDFDIKFDSKMNFCAYFALVERQSRTFVQI
jgi:hypothetical protein